MMTDASIIPGLRAGGVSLGGWCAVPSALSAEAMARSGFGWVCVDMQHGVADYADACEMIRAIETGGSLPVVRVPWNEPAMMGRALDAGALGIIVPMIQTVDDARRAVEACLYPPLGRRSFGPLRVSMRDGPGYFAGANDRIAVLPMIETAEALEAVEEIMTVPGVAGAFVGPADLSLALGLTPRDNDGEPVFDQALARVVAACRGAGKFAAIYSTAKAAPLRLKQGFRMVSVSTDLTSILAGAQADLRAVRDAGVAASA
jgi:4-hydroxy-2-oxoheptanedioate aldolase